MEIRLRLGGVVFLFCGEAALDLNPELLPFLAEEKEDISVTVSRDWENTERPKGNMSGQDALIEYYEEDGKKFCLAKGGLKGALACTCYTSDFGSVVCTLNDKPFLYPIKKLGSVLRMLPMREIFLYFHTLFLHASQVAYGGKGILFSGRSGIGKSTQAGLWKKYRNAEIMCNDRSLIRKTEGIWHTYGYPLDGSEPVGSGDIHELGCIVLLEQGHENEAHRMRPAKAVSCLMPQVVMDGWNGEARMKAMELIIDLLEDIPVYRLTCTPGIEAVETLEEKLKKEKVMFDGEGF